MRLRRKQIVVKQRGEWRVYTGKREGYLRLMGYTPFGSWRDAVDFAIVESLACCPPA